VHLLKTILNYLHYYFTSKTRFDVHSPFVFDFITQVLNDRKQYPEYKTLDDLTSLIATSNVTIEEADLGAGSHFSNRKDRKAVELFSQTALKPKYSKLLFRICNHYKPKYIIELGTGFGTSACSMALAANKPYVTTIEGNESIADLTQKHFTKLKLNNIVLYSGNFDGILPRVLNNVNKVDLAFIDGNHQKDKTIEYFRMIAAKCHNDSIIILDDIRWSEGMMEAWNEIISDTDVTLSFDLFRIGIVFFRKEQKVKEHFVLKY